MNEPVSSTSHMFMSISRGNMSVIMNKFIQFPAIYIININKTNYLYSNAGLSTVSERANSFHENVIHLLLIKSLI